MRPPSQHGNPGNVAESLWPFRILRVGLGGKARGGGNGITQPVLRQGKNVRQCGQLDRHSLRAKIQGPGPREWKGRDGG